MTPFFTRSVILPAILCSLMALCATAEKLKYYPIGCFHDNTGQALPVRLALDDTMTVDSCALLAKDNGFDFFALKRGNVCFAGEDYIDAMAQGTSPSCVTPCAGNSTFKCGGHHSIHLFAFGEEFRPHHGHKNNDNSTQTNSTLSVDNSEEASLDSVLVLPVAQETISERIHHMRDNAERYKSGRHVNVNGTVYKVKYAVTEPEVPVTPQP